MANKFTGKRRVSGNKFLTKSGKTIKVNRTLMERSKARQEAKALRKAERMRGLPKSRLKRVLFRLHPKRVVRYWFSRDGAIMALKLTGVAIVVLFFSLMAVFAYFRKDLPNLKDISGDSIGGSIRYYDRERKTLLWEDYDAVKRNPVEREQIAQVMRDATIAAEDRDFYNHNGFNVKGIVRATLNNARGGSTQGGSTITQQVVKLNNPDFINQRTISRKIKELILSVELERSYSKEEILNGYLNSAPYGGLEYGVQVASKTYFQKDAKDLTLEEAAFLASIPKSIRYLSPYSGDFEKESLQGRIGYVLDGMADMGRITREQAEAAKKVDVIATIKQRQPNKYQGVTAPYFVLAAKRQLESIIGEQGYKTGGFEVTTTLDMEKQKIAEEEVQKGMPRIFANGFDKAAFAAEDVTTGQVVALVGGSDFFDQARSGEINYAQTPLPPGSSFKPYDYLALIEKNENFGAGTVLYDTQGPLEGYPCTSKARPTAGGNCLWDYDFRYPGPMTLRYALGGSRNVPAIKAILTTGVKETIGVADSLGLKGEAASNEMGDGGGNDGYRCFEDDAKTIVRDCYASAGIGDGAYLSLDRHVHAYATISRNGNKIPQTYILKVTDGSGRLVKEWKPSNGEQVVRPDSAYIVADMMADPRASYFSNKPHRYKGWEFSLKTGTTNDSKDGWLMGFSTKYSAGVWVGHHTGRVATRQFMEVMTQPIWQGWMNRAHDGLTPVKREKPAGVQTLPAYVVRTHVGLGSQEPSSATDLYPSWYKKPNVKTETKTIDTVSNKLATDCTPELAKKTLNDSAIASFSGDKFVGGGTVTNEEKDDVHKCDDVKPTITVSVASKPGSPGVYIISAVYASGTHPLSSDARKGTVRIKVAGADIPNGSFEVAASGSVTAEFTALSGGSKDVFAEVVDSVLYSASDTKSFTFSVASVPSNQNNSVSSISRGRRLVAATGS
jgi:penicillin-binding protein 1A